MNSTDETLREVSSLSSSEIWKDRILVPTLFAGIVGGGSGLVSKYRKVHGLANICATYATNFAIVTGCYCCAREFVRETRTSKPDDLWNSVFGGFCSGTILGRLQGGRAGAIRYSIMFAAAGTTVDFAALKLKPYLKSFRESVVVENDGSKKNDNWLRLPEWSPIQVLDEEALAAKRAREEQIYAHRNARNLNKEES